MPGSGSYLAAGGGVLFCGILGIAVVGGAVTGAPAPTAAGSTGTSTGVRPGVVPPPYTDLVTQAGAVCATFTSPVIAAQLHTESGFNPDAVSPAGAQGIAQFMPGTWTTWGRDADSSGTASPFDPGDAIPAEAAYDCALAAQMSAAVAAGQVTGASLTDLALAAYNAGPAAVLAAHGIPAFTETRQYVTTIDTLTAQYAAITLPTGAPSPAPTAAPVGAFAAAEVAAATQQLGLPYIWGGGNPAGPTGGGFDCSGLVLYAVYQASGGTISLPHDSNLQARLGQPVATGPGTTIALSSLQVGDVIAFQIDAGPGRYDHIGIYVGGGLLLHASHPGAGGGVKLEPLTEAYFQNLLWSVRRFG